MRIRLPRRIAALAAAAAASAVLTACSMLPLPPQPTPAQVQPIASAAASANGVPQCPAPLPGRYLEHVTGNGPVDSASLHPGAIDGTVDDLMADADAVCGIRFDRVPPDLSAQLVLLTGAAVQDDLRAAASAIGLRQGEFQLDDAIWNASTEDGLTVLSLHAPGSAIARMSGLPDDGELWVLEATILDG